VSIWFILQYVVKTVPYALNSSYLYVLLQCDVESVCGVVLYIIQYVGDGKYCKYSKWFFVELHVTVCVCSV